MSLFNKATRFLRRNPVSQVALLVAFWLAGEAFVRLADLPVPGGIIGLAALLLLLMTRRLSAISMRRGADWLLADMLLFFVPAVLAILDHREFFGMIGLKILFVIAASTTAVMLVTLLVTDRCYRWSHSYGQS
jgi:Putative effector of murein hydrolase LrgA